MGIDGRLYVKPKAARTSDSKPYRAPATVTTKKISAITESLNKQSIPSRLGVFPSAALYNLHDG